MNTINTCAHSQTGTLNSEPDEVPVLVRNQILQKLGLSSTSLHSKARPNLESKWNLAVCLHPVNLSKALCSTTGRMNALTKEIELTEETEAEVKSF